MGDILHDAVDYTKSVGGLLGSNLHNIITPGFDPIIGNPLKGDFMSGDAILTPTGNFNSDAWQQMYDKAGDNQDDINALNRFQGYNAVADKIAPAIAGYFAGPALGAAFGSSGGSAAGSGISAGGVTPYGGDALGSFDGLSASGASGITGASAGFGGIGGDALGSVQGLSAGGTAGTAGGTIQPIANALSSAGSSANFAPVAQLSAPTTQVAGTGDPSFLAKMFGSTGTNSTPNSLLQLYNSPVSKLGQAAVKIYSGVSDANSQQAMANAYSNNIDSIKSMYAPDGVYAQQLAQQLARTDAASGRNSQYGPRAEKLASDLTQQESQALGNTTYGNQIGAAAAGSTASPWSSILTSAPQIYSGIGSLF